MSSYLSNNCLFTKPYSMIMSCSIMPIILKFHHLVYAGKVVHKRTKKIASLIIFFSFSCTTFNLDKSSKFNASSNTCCFNERQFSKKKLDLCVFQQQQQEHLIQNASGTLKAC